MKSDPDPQKRCHSDRIRNGIVNIKQDGNKSKTTEILKYEKVIKKNYESIFFKVFKNCCKKGQGMKKTKKYELCLSYLLG